ncbi:MAG: LytTR family DNA-binding domain-containing protein [Syntrophomonas sp.]
MLLDVFILEDENYTLRFLEKPISEHTCVESARGFSSSADLCEALITHQPDIIFLDIELAPSEEFNGIELAKRIYASNQGILLVFVTGYASYALESFSVHPFDYLLKPINKERLAKIIQEAAQRIETQMSANAPYLARNRTVIKTGDGLAFIDWNEVYFIEKQGRRVLIHSQQGICTARCLLHELEPFLPEQYIQAHKSFIVNRDKIYLLRDVGNQSFEVAFSGYEPVALMSRAKFREYHRDFAPSL